MDIGFHLGNSCKSNIAGSRQEWLASVADFGKGTIILDYLAICNQGVERKAIFTTAETVGTAKSPVSCFLRARRVLCGLRVQGG
jgi:hypothetical protein